MSLSKKRKVDTEFKVFQEKWTDSYIFSKIDEKSLCLICIQQISVMKKYYIRRLNSSYHSDEFINLQAKQGRIK